eukprot:COSAG06_NODE_53767_length_298_cov_0.773869_1_plen_23_part_10
MIRNLLRAHPACFDAQVLVPVVP